eukprot:7683-Heterococcus_DN1.PRE.2
MAAFTFYLGRATLVLRAAPLKAVGAKALTPAMHDATTAAEAFIVQGEVSNAEVQCLPACIALQFDAIFAMNTSQYTTVDIKEQRIVVDITRQRSSTRQQERSTLSSKMSIPLCSGGGHAMMLRGLKEYEMYSIRRC